jgi:hypothetical protein
MAGAAASAWPLLTWNAGVLVQPLHADEYEDEDDDAFIVDDEEEEDWRAEIRRLTGYDPRK